MNRTRPLAAASLFCAGILALSGCVAKSDPSASAALDVTTTADACDVSADTATSGTLTFEITNEGEQISEFYLLADDGLRIIGEAENIAPGASRSLTVVAQPGEYVTLCKPGMVGSGVGRAPFRVSGDQVAITGADGERAQAAVDLYAAFVKDQVEQLVPAVDEFVAAYESGDDETARELFPQTRVYYERIEPIAEALGDLDPRIDFREVDARADGLDWTGFHRIEKDLWVPAKDALNSDGVTSAWDGWEPSSAAQRQGLGDQLIADIAELNDYVHSDTFQENLDGQGVAGLSNGAIALLDEVATGKISGEEDWWSGTDLWDFAANVDGSRMAFSLVEDIAADSGTQGRELADQITAGYAALEQELSSHGSLENGFVSYGELSDADKRALTDLINALAEPLSQLTVTVLS